MHRYKYTVKASNKNDVFDVDVDIAEAVVFAKDENLAIDKAKKLITRKIYIVTKVEVV